jgi:hypothetical protein
MLYESAADAERAAQWHASKNPVSEELVSGEEG